YVPAASAWPCTTPAKRTRFSPGRPATVKCPIPTQAGETCLTVKTTRPACRRTRMKVVVRRCRGPVVPIQPPDARRPSARGALDDGPAFEAGPGLRGDEGGGGPRGTAAAGA